MHPRNVKCILIYIYYYAPYYYYYYYYYYYVIKIYMQYIFVCS